MTDSVSSEERLKANDDLRRSWVDDQSEPLLHRETECSWILSLLNKCGSNRRAIILSRFGTGKTRFLHDICQVLSTESGLPPSLRSLRISFVSSGAFIVQWLQGRREWGDIGDNELLIVDDLDAFFLTTEAIPDGTSIRLAFLLWLYGGTHAVLATATPSQYDRMHLLEPHWLERLPPFFLRDLTTGEQRNVLLLHRQRYQQLFAVTVPERLLDEIIDLGDTLLKDQPQPRAILDLLESGCATASLRMSRAGDKSENREVTSDDINSQLSHYLRIPIGTCLGISPRQILELKQQLRLEIIGQDKALDQLIKAVQRSLLGTREPGPRRPLGVFLFMGPTGVGKTETSRALSRALFGQDQTLLINMAEFQDPIEGIQRLRGQGLATRIKKNPFSVVVFDEIEKSSPRIREFFLNLFDSGAFKDLQEQDVDASNCFFVLTSNVGAELFEQSRGILPEAFSDQDYSIKKGELLESLKKENFRPEFINRMDDIILFKPLHRQDITAIIESNLRAYGRMIEEAEGKRVVLDEGLFHLLARGCDLNFGARDARRILRKNVYSQVLRTGLYYQAERLIITRGPDLKALDFVTILVCSKNEQDGISLILKLNQEQLALRVRRIDDVREISTSLHAASFDLVILHNSIDEEGKRTFLQAALDQLKRAPHRPGVFLVVDSRQPLQPFRQFMEQGIRGLLRATELEEWLTSIAREIKQRKSMNLSIEYSFDDMTWKQKFDQTSGSLILSLETLGRSDRQRTISE